MIKTKLHNIFKIKTGSRTVEKDVENLLQALGADLSIRVDVNQIWI